MQKVIQVHVCSLTIIAEDMVLDESKVSWCGRQKESEYSKGFVTWMGLIWMGLMVAMWEVKPR